MFRLKLKRTTSGCARHACAAGVLLGLLLSDVIARGQDRQDLAVVRRIDTSGTVSVVRADLLTLVDTDGKSQSFTIQVDPKQLIAVNQGRTAINEHAQIEVKGRAAITVLQPGMIVRIEAEMGLGSKTGSVSSVGLIDEGASPLGVTTTEPTPERGQLVAAEIVGRIAEVKSKRLTIGVPKSELAPRGRLVFDVGEIEDVSLTTNRFTAVKRGDVVTELQGVEISTGDLIVRRIKVDLVGTRATLNLSVDDQLLLKYGELSDEPQLPREVRSSHFVVLTDASDRGAQVMLEKLETMLNLVSRYYGRPLRGTIECVAVDDLNRWDMNTIEPLALNNIRNGSGMTLYRRLGNQRHAAVFSANKHGVVQHEAVHAYCFLTFGSTGPFWYSEGMSEMGKYWTPGDTAVRIEPAVIAYLRGADTQPISQIITAEKIDGESWKAYAWRWALCHLLANNPNYSSRFKQLGIAMMTGQAASFSTMYGDVANQIGFEYEQFVQDFGNGYRADLCAWDWNTQASRLAANRSAKVSVLAARGWQASSVQVDAGRKYAFDASGSWSTGQDQLDVSAQGDEQGIGRLIGVIFDKFQLGEPFELGEKGSFIAPASGTLFVRCREDWCDLADNSGTISLELSLSKN